MNHSEVPSFPEEPILSDLLNSWKKRFEEGDQSLKINLTSEQRQLQDGETLYTVEGTVDDIPIEAKILEFIPENNERNTGGHREYRVVLKGKKSESTTEHNPNDTITEESPEEKKMYFLLCDMLGTSPHL